MNCNRVVIYADLDGPNQLGSVPNFIVIENWAFSGRLAIHTFKVTETKKIEYYQLEDYARQIF